MGQFQTESFASIVLSVLRLTPPLTLAQGACAGSCYPAQRKRLSSFLPVGSRPSRENRPWLDVLSRRPWLVSEVLNLVV